MLATGNSITIHHVSFPAVISCNCRNPPVWRLLCRLAPTQWFVLGIVRRLNVKRNSVYFSGPTKNEKYVLWNCNTFTETQQKQQLSPNKQVPETEIEQYKTHNRHNNNYVIANVLDCIILYMCYLYCVDHLFVWMCLLLVSAYNLSTVRQSWLVASFILFWASQCSMFVAGTPSMARMMSPGHKFAVEALLPGVI